MLIIKHLHAEVPGKHILKGINLNIKPGEVHAIMGPNGSGKSTLAHILSGREGCKISKGEVLYNNKDLLSMAPEERACEGVFLSFQYPVGIPGVSITNFLKAAVNSLRKYRGQDEIDTMDFIKLIKDKLALLKMDETFLSRPVNEGFSGGEKKRNEIFQMAVLEPRLAILDETDSGLDIDSLKVVANGVNSMLGPNVGILVITHYQRLLDYIEADKIHIMVKGRIVRSGGKEIAHELEKKGYDEIIKEAELM